MPEGIPFSQLACINPPLTVDLPDRQSPVSFIPMADVTDTGEWVTRQTRRLADIGAGYTPFQEDDVLFAKITPCMENGKGCQPRGLVNGVGFGSTEFHVLRARGENSPRFIFHWSRFEPLRKKAETAMTGSAGQQRVEAGFFDRFLISDLPTREQPRIAEILDMLDAAIRETEAVATKLRQVKAGLLHDLLTRGLDEHGHVRDPVRHPEQFQGSSLGQIPWAWRIRPIGDFVLSSAFGPRFSGELYHESGNVATMRTTDMDDEGNVDLDAMPMAHLPLSEFSDHLLVPDDVLVSRSGTCGITAVFHGYRKPVLPGAFLIRFRLGSGLLPEFLRIALNWIPNRQRLLIRAEGGVQKNLRTESITGLTLPLPEEPEQDKILSALSIHQRPLDVENNKLSKLQHLKRGLAHDLLTGRVRVKTVCATPE